jgi:mannosyltransferase OCH1-like enzyme
MWERLNPDWNVQIFDAAMTREVIRDDIAIDVFNSLRPPAQSDILRTKLLSVYGGIWVDASCLPHMPINHWVEDFAEADLSALPTGAPGRTIASWFLISKQSGLLLSRH